MPISGKVLRVITKHDLFLRREEIIAVAKRHGASDIRLFGSVARGDATETSDVDFIVRFDPDRSLFDHGGLIDDLENLLGIHVDVVSEGGMRERFRRETAREVVPL
jgi:predicted nucleotidyltransferase